MLAEQVPHYRGLGQLHSQHAAALLALAAVDPGGLTVQQYLQVLPVRACQTEPCPQLRRAHGVQLFQQRVGGGGRCTHLVMQFQRLGSVGDILIILRGNGRGRRQEFAAVIHDKRAVLGQLLIVGIQQHAAVWRDIVAFQQCIFLGRQPHIPPQRYQVRPVHLAQRRVQEPPPPIRPAFDQTQQVRLKHDGLKIPGQCRRAANVRAVQFAGAAGSLAALAAHGQADGFFHVLCLKRPLYDREVTAAPDEFGVF